MVTAQGIPVVMGALVHPTNLPLPHFSPEEKPMEPTEELLLDLYEEVDLNEARAQYGGHEKELCRPTTARSITNH